MLVKFFACVLVLAGSPFFARGATFENAVTHEKLVVSVSDAHVTLSSSPSVKVIRFVVTDGTDSDYQLEKREGVIELRSRDQLSKSHFGKMPKKKRDLEILVPSQTPVDIHILEGSLLINKFSRELLAHLGRGRMQVKDCGGTLTLHSNQGEINVIDSQGRMNVDSVSSQINIKNYSGDLTLQNFSGASSIDRMKGFLSLHLGSGTTRVAASSGNLQFDLAKGVLNVAAFGGRVEGQTLDGPVHVNLALDSDLNIKSESGRVSVITPAQSGAYLNVQTMEGEIFPPSTMKVARDGGIKYLRGRMKGEAQKATIVIRAQSASIAIK